MPFSTMITLPSIHQRTTQAASRLPWRFLVSFQPVVPEEEGPRLLIGGVVGVVLSLYEALPLLRVQLPHLPPLLLIIGM